MIQFNQFISKYTT